MNIAEAQVERLKATFLTLFIKLLLFIKIIYWLYSSSHVITMPPKKANKQQEKAKQAAKQKVRSSECMACHVRPF